MKGKLLADLGGLAVLAEHFDLFAFELSHFVSALGGWGDAELHFFAFGLNDELLGLSVEGLQRAFSGGDFAAACEAGASSEGECCEGGEEDLHMCGVWVCSAVADTETKRDRKSATDGLKQNPPHSCKHEITS